MKMHLLGGPSCHPCLHGWCVARAVPGIPYTTMDGA